MNIQLITENKYTQKEDLQGTNYPITISPFNAPHSFDEFDINVIDLSAKNIWQNKNRSYYSVDSINDFRSIGEIIKNKSKSKVIIILPQNETLYYNKSQQKGSYYEYIVLKDMLSDLKSNYIDTLVPYLSTYYSIGFETSNTKVGDLTYSADFYFKTDESSITQSISDKITTIQFNDDDVYGTTLNISKSIDDLRYFLKKLFEPAKKEPVPEWICDIIFADDETQNAIISKCQEEITEANTKIEIATEKLEENGRFKSILYTNGDELVSVVFEILEKLFNYDLSNFVDVGKEDFLIQLPSCTFIGEIKGVNSNVKSEHISQVDVHYQGYKDKLDEEGESEEVHEILILNPFKTKAPSEREPIHETQIKLAERNGCLIIETATLLRIFEKFLNGEIDTEKCTEIFSSKIGLLKLEDFE